MEGANCLLGVDFNQKDNNEIESIWVIEDTTIRRTPWYRNSSNFDCPEKTYECVPATAKIVRSLFTKTDLFGFVHSKQKKLTLVTKADKRWITLRLKK